ncbi:hypothetical protein [Oceanisphaera psychrotolerans]|uniref:hypothetical protein n=1 Tax=Oceanisphaera psychrotolerans TaxID=1414654 RepID=UPI001587432A|nr:hypothetical protein [Oceanisphaera psychrotolerans]
MNNSPDGQGHNRKCSHNHYSINDEALFIPAKAGVPVFYKLTARQNEIFNDVWL